MLERHELRYYLKTSNLTSRFRSSRRFTDRRPLNITPRAALPYTRTPRTIWDGDTHQRRWAPVIFHDFLSGISLYRNACISWLGAKRTTGIVSVPCSTLSDANSTRTRGNLEKTSARMISSNWAKLTLCRSLAAN